MFIINLIFIIIFWSLIYKIFSLYVLDNYTKQEFMSKNIILIFTIFNCYYYDLMNPSDLYSNTNPEEYMEILKFVENWIRDIYKNYPNGPNHNFFLLDHDSDQDDDQEFTCPKNIFVDVPKEYLKQAVHKDPYGRHKLYLNIMDHEANLREMSSIEGLYDAIDNHNNNLDYARNHPDLLEELTNKWKLDPLSLREKILWSTVSIDHVLDKSYNTIDYVLWNVVNNALISLQEYNGYLAGFYFYNAEDSSQLPSECSKFYTYLKSRYSRGCWDTLMDIDCLALADYQLLVDSDIYPHKFHYIKNYLEDSKTYEEIGDNLLITGISTIYWYYIEQFVLEAKQDPNITFENLISKLKNYSNQVWDQYSFKPMLNVYTHNYFNYDIETTVSNDIMALSRKLSYMKKSSLDINLTYTNHFGKNYEYNSESGMSYLGLIYGNSHQLIKDFSASFYIYNHIFKLPFITPLPEQTLEELNDLYEDVDYLWDRGWRIFEQSLPLIEDVKPEHIPLPQVTFEEEEFFFGKDVNIKPENIPLPDATVEEEKFFLDDNVPEKEKNSIEKNSIGEDLLYEALQGNFFPEDY